MKINLVGAFLDSSGYAQFARNLAVAIGKTQHQLSLEPLSFEPTHTNHTNSDLIKRLIGKGANANCDINIVNMIPKVFEAFRKPGALNVGFTMFETSRLPKVWVDQCNAMDAIAVPCQWNQEVFRNSGVTVPIIVSVPGIDPSILTRPITPFIHKKNYKFYSVFQWSERKNPTGLIKAFNHAFYGNKDVSLTIKSYIKGHTPEETELLRREVLAIRDSMGGNPYPQIFIKCEKLSEEQMVSFHRNHDCFVLPSRAEGLGLPYIDAMSHAKPTIGTRYSGNLEFMNDQNSYLIDCCEEPVFNMKHLGGWYTGDMLWGSPNLGQLAQRMRWVYEHQAEAHEQGKRAQESLSHFNPIESAENLINSLKEIKK